MKKILVAFILIFILVIPAFAQNKDLLSVKHADLSITITEKPELSFQINLTSTKSKDITTDVFALANPTRLVIDVLDHQSPSSLNKTITNEKVTQLRIGVHPTKTRLVLDINNPAEPFFTRNESGKNLSVTFGFPGISSPDLSATATADTSVNDTQVAVVPIDNAPTQTEKVPANTTSNYTPPTFDEEPPIVPAPEEFEVSTPIISMETTPEAPPVEEPTPTPTPIVIEEPKSIEIAEPTPAATPTESRPDVNSKQSAPAEDSDEGTIPDDGSGFFPESQQRALVKEINFKKTPDNENAIAVSVDHLGRYSFRQMGAQSFSLVIENAIAEEENVMLTQFPPDHYKGIEAVTAYKKNKNIIVKIYVEKGVKLLPYRLGTDLWIKAMK